MEGKDPSGKIIGKLNEIELIDGSIWFNMWCKNATPPAPPCRAAPFLSSAGSPPPPVLAER